MTKVTITSGQHQVHVDHDGGDLTYVIEKAQKLFAATTPPEKPAGPATGFVMEREARPRWKPAAFGVEQLPVRGQEVPE